MSASEFHNSREAGSDASAGHSRARLRAVSFWVLAVLLMFFLIAASAPSPLYATYQKLWHFSPIVLTEVYAAYALGGLVTLLTTGRLSDHLGRRPVVMFALVVQVAGMAAFIAAQGVGALFVARSLQGIGAGIALGAISAWLLDLQPANNQRLGSLVVAIAPLTGLAVGAMGAALLVQYGPDPLHLVFWLLAGIYAIALAATMFMPDPAPRAPGWLQSLSPRIGVPPAARFQFASFTPSYIANWALGGLYLALGPSLAISLLRTQSYIAGGIVIVALMGAGAVASALTQAVQPRVLVIRGSLVLIVGVGLTLLSVAFGSIVGLYAGSLIAGLGLGPASTGVLRGLLPLAPPDKRSTLAATTYLVLYLSLSIPAIIAGVAVSRYGLRDTALVFGLVVMALAATTMVAVSRRQESVPTSAPRRSAIGSD